MKKNFFVAALTLGVATLASTLLSASAKADSVNADVEITVQIPSFVFLQTYKSLSFKPQLSEVTTETTGRVFQETDGVISSVTSPEPLPDQAGVGISNSYNSSLSYENVQVYKVWGTPQENEKLYHKVTYNGNLTKEGTDDSITMTVTGDSVTDSETGTEITGEHGTYDTALLGRLNFSFDLGDNPKAGTYSGGTVTITAYTL